MASAKAETPMVPIFNNRRQQPSSSGQRGYQRRNYNHQHHVNFTDDPAMSARKLAHVNADINKMSKEDILNKLQNLNLNCTGNKDAIKRRLKNHYRKQRAVCLAKAPQNPKVHDRFDDYLCVVDFECTCEDNIYDYAHEIIEFPIVLVKTSTLEIVDEFRAVVKPVLHPEISPFCTKLTGITQADCDAAKPFIDVMDDVRGWMADHKLGTEFRYSFVTDGPWDLGKFFQMQCLITGLPAVPHDFRYWINLRRSFSNIYRNVGSEKSGNHKPNEWRNLAGMLAGLGMEFEGRPHSGIDDARNIARIALRMLTDGCELRINERLVRRDRADKIMQRKRIEAEQRRQRDAERSGTVVERRQEEEVTEKKEESQEDRDRHLWREELPYKVCPVSRNEFLMNTYDQCLTCSEESAEDSDS